MAHGLSQAPELILFKNIDSVLFWPVYNKTIDATDYLQLNADTARADSDGYFNDTEPTASVFSLGDKTNLNRDTCIAYCFHSVEGYSKVGSYEGNGNADGPLIYTGFSPKFFLSKNLDNSQNWTIQGYYPGYNPEDRKLIPNEQGAEGTGSNLDFLSNGVKWRVSNNEGNTK